MRTSLRGGQVIAGKGFRCNEESILALDRNEASQKTRSELTMSVTDYPHLGKRCIEGTHHRVTCGPRNAKVPLFEGANLAIGDW